MINILILVTIVIAFCAGYYLGFKAGANAIYNIYHAALHPEEKTQ